MNRVSYIKFIVESKPLSVETKIKLKKVGPHRPSFPLSNTQKFNTEYYKLAKWLCGCPEKKALYCYTCLVTDNTRSGPWIDGVTTDLENLKELNTKVEKHQRYKKHMVNSLDYALLGSNISERTREWSSDVLQRNEKVQEHRFLLNKLINCVKDVNELNFAEEMKKIVNESKNSVPSKETICHEVLESIYTVCVNLIKKELEQTDYVSVEFDEATTGGLDLIFIVRYELHGQIHERFVKFVEKSEEFSSVVLKELEILDIDCAPNKLISYSHDGLSLCTQNDNEHAKITPVYEKAKYIFSYNHKLDLIVERAASTQTEAKIFFASLANFKDFFSREEYVARLDKATEKRLLRGTKIKWNFDTQTAFIVSVHKDSIKECLNQIIEEETDRAIIAKALALKNLFSDSDFKFWLEFFNKLLPNCDRLFNQFLGREGCDMNKVSQYLEVFKTHVKNLECAIDYQLNQYYMTTPPPNKRQCVENITIKEEITIEEIDLNVVKQEVGEEVVTPIDSERKRNEAGKSVCNVIINTLEDHFSYLEHLSIAALVQVSFFPKYETCFPNYEIFRAGLACGLVSDRLISELQIIYNRNELSKVEGAVVLLQYLYKYKLTNSFSETFKLLKVICTMPMITNEHDRCFTTLTNVKELFKKAYRSTNPDAYVMCSLGKDLMLRTPNFNDLVMKDFCRRNNRRVDFDYKRVC